MQKIVPFLWFDAQAEEAVAFYLSVFKDGKIHATTRYPEDGPQPAGTVMTIAFELQGEQFSWRSRNASGQRRPRR
ncbi:MAG: VOC family protein [Chthoniobacterales bacterium]|nr:VOC family protein [Chthoniobacterales bacterium]